MPRRVFYSFHYSPDVTRVARLRNIGLIEGNRPCSDNDWEQVKGGGDAAIRRWIDDQMYGKSCTIVMIGQQTANRKWINYEIEESWARGMGVFGIRIHRIQNLQGQYSQQGPNPFARYDIGNDNAARIIPTYDPPYLDSRDNYNHIAKNIAFWIENAIAVRKRHGGKRYA